VSNYWQTPGNAGFRDYSPGPHSGVDTDPDAHVVSDSLDSRARTALTLGLLSLLLSVLTGIPAIWVGVKALKRVGRLGPASPWAASASSCVRSGSTFTLTPEEQVGPNWTWPTARLALFQRPLMPRRGPS